MIQKVLTVPFLMYEMYGKFYVYTRKASNNASQQNDFLTNYGPICSDARVFFIQFIITDVTDNPIYFNKNFLLE